MSRHSRTKSGDASFAIIVLVGAAAWTHREQLVHIAYIALAVTSCLILLKLFWAFLRRHRIRQLRDVDTMSGLDFERYVAALLRSNGFHKVSLTEKYDFGIDIIAEKDGTRWGIQAKRHTGLVKASAIRQVVTGLNIYGCDQAMVITNSTYSTIAKRLAKANGCVLVDRTGLKRLTKQRCIL